MASPKVLSSLWVIALNVHVRIAKGHFDDIALLVSYIHRKLFGAAGCPEGLVEGLLGLCHTPLSHGRGGKFHPVSYIQHLDPKAIAPNEGC